VISVQETELVLSKWLNEETPLHVIARFADCAFGFDCRIVGYGAKVLRFYLSGEIDACEIYISGFIFDYAASSELSESSVGNRVYPSGLRGYRNQNECLFILEIAA
jgi:hypothetical protein